MLPSLALLIVQSSASTSPLWKGLPHSLQTHLDPTLLLSCFPLSTYHYLKHPPTCWITCMDSDRVRLTHCQSPSTENRPDTQQHSTMCAGWTKRNACVSSPQQSTEDGEMNLNWGNSGCFPKGWYLSQILKKGEWTKGLRVQDSRKSEGHGQEAWTQGREHAS